jgi:hypothetical protein
MTVMMCIHSPEKVMTREDGNDTGEYDIVVAQQKYMAILAASFAR